MSRCGSCRSGLCTCQFTGDGSTAQVIGLGSSYEPYHVRPLLPVGPVTGSSPALYRPVAFVRRTTDQSITLNTDTAISFENNDLPFGFPASMWDFPQPTRITAPIQGLYMVGGHVGISNAGASQTWAVWVAKNGLSSTPLGKRSTTVPSGGYDLTCDVMTLIRLSAGDYIELYVRSSRSALTASSPGSGSPGAFWDSSPVFWAQWMGA